MERSMGLFLFFMLGFFGQVGFFVDVWKGRMPFWVGFGIQLFPFMAAYFGMSILEESTSRRWAWWGGRLAEWGLVAYLSFSGIALCVALGGIWRPSGWMFFLALIVVGLLPGVVFWRGLGGWRLALLSRTAQSPMGWVQQQGERQVRFVESSETALLKSNGMVPLESSETALLEDEDDAAWEEIRGMLEEADLAGGNRWARLPKEAAQSLDVSERIKRIGWDPFLMGAVYVVFLALTVWIHLYKAWQARPLMLWASYAMWGGGLMYCVIDVVQRGAQRDRRVVSAVRARRERLWKAWMLFFLSVCGFVMLWMAWTEAHAESFERWLLAGVSVFYALMIFPALQLIRLAPSVFYALGEEGLLEKHPEGTLLWPWAVLSWSSLQERAQGRVLCVGIAAKPLEGALERGAFSLALREVIEGLRWEPRKQGAEDADRRRVFERVHRRCFLAAQSVDWEGLSYLSCEFVEIGEEQAQPSLCVLMESLANNKQSTGNDQREFRAS
ncbi:ABC transporter permease [Myxococcota bacterium]|nr:ABC transporter permease [Myxococcota bacterium]